MELKCTALSILTLAGLLGAAVADAAPAPLITTQKLPWQTAEQLASKAVALCAAKGYSVTAAVVDPSGHEQVVIKGDSVPLQSLSVAYRKAYTAFSYGQAFDKNTTSELIAAHLDGPANGALNTVPEVLFIAGGVTLRKADHQVIGGLGVSGAPGGDKDEACALDAVKAYQASFQ
ncbi:MAG: heme-binding protein [Pseudomonas sp.]|uniref:GlcG/HbpS family heme-binding protein n=1 Tax=Pseudomonas abieticivorans TaxID=2931382 RepID=UPI0020BDA80B|nr:heme-binding protein [Pseudomonas sp. PIA16]MDE1164940.1 heme-binding protein [Pseudomonas sp.]